MTFLTRSLWFGLLASFWWSWLSANCLLLHHLISHTPCTSYWLSHFYCPIITSAVDAASGKRKAGDWEKEEKTCTHITYRKETAIRAQNTGCRSVRSAHKNPSVHDDDDGDDLSSHWYLMWSPWHLLLLPNIAWLEHHTGAGIDRQTSAMIS